MKLIRFRTCEHSLVHLKTFGIDASPYGQFESDEPLDIRFMRPPLGICKEQLSTLIYKMRNHIKKAYRLASFMIYKNGDELDRRMWTKYADNGNGFALLYKLQDIKEAVEKAVKTEPIFVLRRVVYGNTIGCDSFLLRLIELANESENKSGVFEKKLQDGKWITSAIREEIMSVLTTKEANEKYTKDKEYRLIDMKRSEKGPHQPQIHIKPIRVYAKACCPALDEISSICSQNEIPLVVLESD